LGEKNRPTHTIFTKSEKSKNQGYQPAKL